MPVASANSRTPSAPSSSINPPRGWPADCTWRARPCQHRPSASSANRERASGQCRRSAHQRARSHNRPAREPSNESVAGSGTASASSHLRRKDRVGPNAPRTPGQGGLRPTVVSQYRWLDYPNVASISNAPTSAPAPTADLDSLESKRPGQQHIPRGTVSHLRCEDRHRSHSRHREENCRDAVALAPGIHSACQSALSFSWESAAHLPCATWQQLCRQRGGHAPQTEPHNMVGCSCGRAGTFLHIDSVRFLPHSAVHRHDFSGS